MLNTQRLTTLLIHCALPLALPGAIILLEDFETDGDGTRYLATGVFSNGIDDYFTRTMASGGPSALPAYTGYSGDWFWAAEDTDGSGDDRGFLDLVAIPVADHPALTISLLVGAGATDRYDLSGDHLKVWYRFDDQPFSLALAFENNGATFNSALFQDTNFDGIGDGIQVGLQLQNFISQPIAVAGLTLDIRIEAFVNAGGETLAFDRLQVVAVPEPATIAALLGSAALLLTVRRRSKRASSFHAPASA
jgi:hypothetical protein